jgi:hypothetical protein
VIDAWPDGPTNAQSYLAQAEEHFVTGDKNIFAELERGGHQTRQAIATLAQFEELQAMHLADRDRILR